ncbi:TPA: LOW QUALITY PROTEIN: hypothetical protein N0F65_011179 [Lagenidium giganteum]|uniref:Uncharacterized protein n=1 Tax=Lagenidium giganteum TaxID=4803 RepID=A0AAV2Z9K8_9STRA|nr:TPA: LOW QUALITY PROTEIN: hypothetical protein N0F65_011179 [Lagenidium giganteum]
MARSHNNQEEKIWDLLLNTYNASAPWHHTWMRSTHTSIWLSYISIVIYYVDLYRLEKVEEKEKVVLGLADAFTHDCVEMIELTSPEAEESVWSSGRADFTATGWW